MGENVREYKRQLVGFESVKLIKPILTLPGNFDLVDPNRPYLSKIIVARLMIFNVFEKSLFTGTGFKLSLNAKTAFDCLHILRIYAADILFKKNF